MMNETVERTSDMKNEDIQKGTEVINKISMMWVKRTAPKNKED